MGEASGRNDVTLRHLRYLGRLAEPVREVGVKKAHRR